MLSREEFCGLERWQQLALMARAAERALPLIVFDFRVPFDEMLKLHPESRGPMQRFKDQLHSSAKEPSVPPPDAAKHLEVVKRAVSIVREACGRGVPATDDPVFSSDLMAAHDALYRRGFDWFRGGGPTQWCVTEIAIMHSAAIMPDFDERERARLWEAARSVDAAMFEVSALTQAASRNASRDDYNWLRQCAAPGIPEPFFARPLWPDGQPRDLALWVERSRPPT
jgi:hypothetical protein